ncbi:MAG TPA: DUF459 domain-containing protein [Pseudolabrys sp.]|nr:DUF459 domain-containing protein [Pseudolabrys sp.]
MFGKIRVSRWLLAAAVLALAEGAGVVALGLAFAQPAQAQWFGDDSYRRPRPPRSNGGFFQNLFGPFNERSQQYPGYSPEQHRVQQPVDNSRAPPPRKPDAKAEPVVPTTSIMVMGDGMADWLAYGLEEAFADTPEVAILRKNKLHSGLLRYDPKGDLDWWHEARDILAPEKPNIIIMMIGISDRQDIRERDLAKEAEKKAKEEKEKSEADKDKQDGKKSDTPEQPKIAAPEPPRVKKPNGVVEFRSEEWEKIYTRRIDDTIAALKSKGVPVLWVGLPSIRGTKSTADVVYLNELYRTRAERAGITYIDVWDGFVDDNGRFVTFGPDYEGQTRRLRSGDGVYFTKYGARKLAHYVEREIRRFMANRGPIALPSGIIGPAPGEGKPAERPLAGPVVPLTVTPSNSDVLLGGAGSANARGDAIATQVLIKGEPVNAPPGRADDFVWPRGSVRPAPPPPAKPTAAAPAATPTAANPPAAATAPKPASAPTAASAEKPAQPAPEHAVAKTSPAPVAAHEPFAVRAVPTPEQSATDAAAPTDKPFAVKPSAAPDGGSTPAISVEEPAAAPEKKPAASKKRVQERTVQNGTARARPSHPGEARTRGNPPRPPRPVGQQQPRSGGLFDIFR